MKKILAKKIQPGMVVAIKHQNEYNEVCLVIAVSGYTEIEYSYINIQDFYGDILIGKLSGDTKVKIITGRQRNYVLGKIKKMVFNHKNKFKKMVFNHKNKIGNILDILNIIQIIDKN